MTEVIGEIEKQENRRAAAAVELMNEVLEKRADDEGLFDAMTMLTLDAILDEDMETLSQIHNIAGNAFSPVYDLTPETKARIDTIVMFVNWGMVRFIPEVTPEQSTWLQLAVSRGGYKKDSNALEVSEQTLLQDGLLVARRFGQRIYIEASPKGRLRLERDNLTVENYRS